MAKASDLTWTYKDSDAWWTVLLVDPIAVHVLRLATHLRWITPNRVTLAAFGIGLGSAVCFARGTTGWLIAGAVCYHVAFILDCVDGKLARWQRSTSSFGAWLDIAMDRLRILACTIGLMGGQFAATGRPIYLYLGLGIVFLDVFRQWNGLLVFKMRLDMRERINAVGVAHTATDLQGQLGQRYGAFVRLSSWLQRRRIRPHLISGVEFQMAVFIVAPITGLILTVPIAVGVLFVVFELLIMYKFWLTTNDYERELAALDATARPRAARAVRTGVDPADVPIQRSDTPHDQADH